MDVDEAAGWGRLSRSSKTALRWAWALAWVREGADLQPFDARPDGDDILVGVLLSHPRDNELRTLLEHFGVSPRRALEADYPAIDLDRLVTLAQRLPADKAPELMPYADTIVREAVEHGAKSGSPDHAELRALAAALLRVSTPTTTRLLTALADAGGDGSGLIEVFDRHLRGGHDGEESSGASTQHGFAELLAERFPRRPVAIPDYKADQITLDGAGDDLLGIQAEVDAFAYLLASRALVPPLAVGLFGDWGSGKSFFMRAVRQRIQRLTSDEHTGASAQRDLPFWKHVIQIDFNAWHYVEGSLWASLVEHIFSHLALSPDEQPDQLAQRRQAVIERLESVARKGALATQRRKQVRADLAAKRKKVNRAEASRDDQRRKLQEQRAAAFTAQLGASNRREVTDLLGAAGTSVAPGAAASAAELTAALAESRALLQRGRGLLGPFWSGWRVAAAVLGTLLIPAVAAGLDAVSASGAVQAGGALATILAYLASLLGVANRFLRDRLTAIDAAQRTVAEAEATALASIEGEIAIARDALARAEDTLRDAERDERMLRAEADRLDAELATITPTRMLTDFVSQRAGTDDYRRHLGVAALIRRDFEQLATLIRDQNQEIIATDTDDPSEQLGVNRIILYIDDLDRCPPEQVVGVLQAIHLLLAFDLFVVVVAVDARWLTDSLLQRHPTLVAEASEGHATPQNYLEKIFQLPFWVQPLDSSGRRELITGLLSGNLVRPAGGEVDAGAEPSRDLTLDDTERTSLTELFGREGRPRLTAETLAITPEDLAFVQGLAPLLGQTPRDIKRFVNVFQLLAAMPSIGADIGANGDAGAVPSPSSIAAFLACVAEGMPVAAPHLFAAIDAANTPDAPATLRTLLARVEPGPAGAEIRRLEAWLAANPSWWEVPLARLARPLPLVRRLSFTSPGHRDLPVLAG